MARYACPAVGPSATVSCPRRKEHPKAADKPKGRIMLPLLVKPAPRVCEQQSMKISPLEGEKYAQEYPYKSEKWQEHYTGGRQMVESLNASLKNGAHMPIDTQMRPRRGFAAQIVSLTVMVAATNTRKIIAWLHEQVGVTALSLGPGQAWPPPRAYGRVHPGRRVRARVLATRGGCLLRGGRPPDLEPPPRDDVDTPRCCGS
ncbi:hypothetical protein GY12_19080 [Micrococcus luteus]|nr:hypothetical protein GY12_19080 [Micrococcus luteus]